jgi:hypothetical protein
MAKQMGDLETLFFRKHIKIACVFSEVRPENT